MLDIKTIKNNSNQSKQNQNGASNGKNIKNEKPYLINKLELLNKKSKRTIENNNNTKKINNEKKIGEINGSGKEKNVGLKKLYFKKELINDCYVNFIIFRSINDILYLVYVRNTNNYFRKNNSLVCYDVIANQKVNEIKKLYSHDIEELKHIYDIKNNQDLILTLCEKHVIKLWNIYNWECLFKLTNKYKIITSIINDNNNKYIIVLNYNYKNPIKLYDLKGTLIKQIDNYKSIEYIDTFYDNKLSKNYLLFKSDKYIYSYDYNKNQKYQDYFYEYNILEKRSGYTFVINDYGEVTKLIGASYNMLISSNNISDIKIWEFHSGKFLQKIDLGKALVSCIYLWNYSILFAGLRNNKKKPLIMICLNNGEINKDLINNNINTKKTIDTEEYYTLNYITKLNHPCYGESLLIKDSNDSVKLYTPNEINNLKI